MNYFEFWHWWALALIFVVVEAVMPSGVFMSMALAGGFMGAIFLTFPDITWQAQLGGFAAFTMALTYPVTHFYRKKLGSHDDFRSVAAKLIGEEVTLTMPIQNGFGEITVDDQIWSLKGPDIKKGERVKIIGIDGDMLVVRPVNIPKEEAQ